MHKVKINIQKEDSFSDLASTGIVFRINQRFHNLSPVYTDIVEIVKKNMLRELSMMIYGDVEKQLRDLDHDINIHLQSMPHQLDIVDELREQIQNIINSLKIEEEK